MLDGWILHLSQLKNLVLTRLMKKNDLTFRIPLRTWKTNHHSAFAYLGKGAIFFFLLSRRRIRCLFPFFKEKFFFLFVYVYWCSYASALSKHFLRNYIKVIFCIFNSGTSLKLFPCINFLPENLQQAAGSKKTSTFLALLFCSL